MKISTKMLFAAALLAVSYKASAQTLLDDFETTRLVNYPRIEGTLDVVANPGSSAGNTSASVAKFVRDATKDYATTVITPKSGKFGDIASYIAGTKTLTMKFRSPDVGTTVQLVLQNRAKNIVEPYNYPQGNYLGTFDAKTTTANTWETLTFKYSPGGADATVTADMIDQIAMLVDLNSKSGKTYYFDDVKGTTLATAAVTPQLLEDFENTRLLNYPAIAGTLEAVANPGSSTGNTSAKVGMYVRNTDEYATVSINPKSGNFGDILSYTDGTKKITMKMRSNAPAGTEVLLVFQNKAKAGVQPYVYPQGDFLGTFKAVTTAAPNTWETLTFTFGARGADNTVTADMVDQLAFLVAPGKKVAGTYYIDDLTGPTAATVTATRVSQTSVAAFAVPYPNPTAGSTTLSYSLKKAAVVSLAVYDNMGRRAAQVLNQQARPAGQFTAELNASQLAPGLYTCRLMVDGVALTRALSVQ